MRNVALITGASSGIGLELARIHAAAGGHLVVVARREDTLMELKSSLQSEFGVEVRVIGQDLARRDAANSIVQILESDRIEVDYLINNAGIGGYGFFHERTWEQEREMVQVNIASLVELTRLLLPGMVLRGRGRVLNVASVVGFFPGPLQAVYHATKAFVISFSEAIANELAGTGVTVTALCPGATRTEFREAAGLNISIAYERVAAPAERVAAYGYRAMMQGHRIAVPGLLNKLSAGLPRLLPRRIMTLLSRKIRENV